MAGHGLTIRGDSLYCPLSFSLDAYWNCVNNCYHCYLRKLNHTWGTDLRPIDPNALHQKLYNGILNKNPKSALAHALAQKKTIRFGNKSDPFQEPEKKHRVSLQIMSSMLLFNWSYVIQTMCTDLMMEYEDLIIESKEIVIVQPIISPGAESDWEILERKRTTPIQNRFDAMMRLKTKGVRVAVNGEPFIPGYHTVKQFEDMVKRLKSNGINIYNTYNFHFNAFVAKRLAAIGIDVMKIWEMNQDSQWKPIIQQLIDICKKYDILLGCPDFVNVGATFRNTANTCCGINVENPTTYNTHTWRNMILDDTPLDQIRDATWDGVGDYEQGQEILKGKPTDQFYTMRDAGLVDGEKEDGALFDI